MTATFEAPPAPMRSVAQIADWLRRDRTSAVTLLVDPAVRDQSVTARTVAAVRNAGLEPELLLVDRPGDLTAIRELADRLAPGELLVAVGGGTVLDLAQLAGIVAATPVAWGWLAAPQRSGIVALPPRLGERVRVIAVPTTLGTGSELGTVACLPHEGGKRLATGPCLRPVACVHAAEATATLPVELVAEGVLEALFRTVSPYVGDPTELPEQDAAVELLAARLVAVGDEVAERRRASSRLEDGVRLRIAALSAESQVGWINIGRSPYAVKGWALANELSSTLGLSKMRAVAAVWPVLWRRILDGDSRLGDAGRIHRLWQVLRERTPRLDPDPVVGLRRLIDEWRIDRVIVATPAEVTVAANRAVRAWGAGLPILGRLGAGEVRELLAEAVEATDLPDLSERVDRHDAADAVLAPGDVPPDPADEKSAPTDPRVPELRSVA